jgi:phage terminase large subunit-like protein
LLLNTVRRDGNRVRIGFGQEPGQAGKSQALHLVHASAASPFRQPRRVYESYRKQAEQLRVKKEGS